MTSSIPTLALSTLGCSTSPRVPGRLLRSKSEAPAPGRRSSEFFAIHDVDSSDDEHPTAVDGSALSDIGQFDLETLFEFNIDQLISVAREATCSRLPGLPTKSKGFANSLSPRRSARGVGHGCTELKNAPEETGQPKAPASVVDAQLAKLRQEMEYKDKQLERLRRVVCELLVWGTSEKDTAAHTVLAEALPEIPSPPEKKRNSNLRAAAPEFVSLGIPSLANMPIKQLLRRTKSAAPVATRRQKEEHLPKVHALQTAQMATSAQVEAPILTPAQQVLVPTMVPSWLAAQMPSNSPTDQWPQPDQQQRAEKLGCHDQEAATGCSEAEGSLTTSSGSLAGFAAEEDAAAAEVVAAAASAVPGRATSAERRSTEDNRRPATSRMERPRSRVAFKQDDCLVSPPRVSPNPDTPEGKEEEPQSTESSAATPLIPPLRRALPTHSLPWQSASARGPDCSADMMISPRIEKVLLDKVEWPSLAEVAPEGRKRRIRSRSRNINPTQATGK